MKKMIAFVLLICLCAGSLSGCGGSEKKNSAGANEIKELKIAVSPYQDAETVKTAVGPLSTMLQGKLKEKGFTVVTVNVINAGGKIHKDTKPAEDAKDKKTVND